MKKIKDLHAYFFIIQYSMKVLGTCIYDVVATLHTFINYIHSYYTCMYV